MNKYLGVIAGLLVSCQPLLAIADARLVGTWKLVSFDLEDKDTGKLEPAFGARPRGYVIFTPEGRMSAIITADDRQTPKSDEERAAAFRSMMAYSGKYQIDGDKWTTRVDVSWTEAWRGTDQVRHFRIEGGKLMVISAWGPRPSNPAQTNRGILILERDQ